MRKLYGGDFDLDDLDAEEMLKKVNKDLKLTDYTLCHIVTSGFSHFKKLRVTTTEAVEAYIEQIKA